MKTGHSGLVLPVPSDAQLSRQVATRILGEPRLLGETITVQVQNGVVDLAGTVGSLYARATAAEVARSTPGVADVCNRLALARVADVSMAPDPFDELIAHWDDDLAAGDPPVPATTQEPAAPRQLPKEEPATTGQSAATGHPAKAGHPARAGHPAAAARTFRIGSALTAGVALMMWLVVVPEFGAIALLIVLPFAVAALGLARLARRAESTKD
jgi:hypothetical protein